MDHQELLYMENEPLSPSPLFHQRIDSLWNTLTQRFSDVIHEELGMTEMITIDPQEAKIVTVWARSGSSSASVFKYIKIRRLYTILQRCFHLSLEQKKSTFTLYDDLSKLREKKQIATHFAVETMKKLSTTSFISLRRLDLSHCRLSFMPNLESCSQLLSLTLAKNGITYIPAVGHPPKIEAIDLSENPVYHIACQDLRVKKALAFDQDSKKIMEYLFELLQEAPPSTINKVFLYFLTINNPSFQKKLKRVTELNLSAMKLQSLPLLILQKLPHLQILDLRHNEIEILPEGISHPCLERLLLLGNKITQFPETLDLPSLKLLDLSYNRLSSFPQLHSFPQLKTIRLTGNMISALPKDLQPLLKMDEVALFANPISDFSKKLAALSIIERERLQLICAIDDLVTLWDLLVEEFIYSCHSTENRELSALPTEREEIIDYIFSKAGELTQFENRDFFLTELRLPEKISLAGRQLDHVPQTVLALMKTKGSTILDLCDNNLAELPTDFVGQFREIRLDGNKIKKIPTNFYHPSLESISLRNNLIDIFPRCSLPKVKKVDLRYNWIRQLPPFLPWPTICSIKLEGNPLHTLPGNFESLLVGIIDEEKEVRAAKRMRLQSKEPSMISLPTEILAMIAHFSIDFCFYRHSRCAFQISIGETHRQNRLTTLIRLCQERLLTAAQIRFKNILSFPLGDEPLSSLEIVQRTNFYHLRILRKSLKRYCDIPEDQLIDDQPLAQLANDRFRERYIEPLTPIITALFPIPVRVPAAETLAEEYCIENFRDLDLQNRNLSFFSIAPFWRVVNVTKLDLSYNHFRSIKDLPLKQLDHLRKLNLSNNALEKVIIPEEALSSLESLFLADNQIKKIRFFAPDSLEFLDLTNNKLTSIPDLGKDHPIPNHFGLSHNLIQKGVGDFLQSIDELADEATVYLSENPLVENQETLIKMALDKSIQLILTSYSEPVHKTKNH